MENVRVNVTFPTFANNLTQNTIIKKTQPNTTKLCAEGFRVVIILDFSFILWQVHRSITPQQLSFG